MKILGIDPGSIKCGYGLIGIRGKDPFYIMSGTISPSAAKPLHERLKHIFEALQEIVRDHRPDHIAVEKIFFAKGAKAALSLGHARGIALLVAASGNIDLFEYSALEVKKAVVGYGRAEKQQVMQMVKLILTVRDPLLPDSADALGLALCHANTIKFNQAISKS
jgi:crossover junction endodeoxyribonuclease RuvC